MRELYYYHADGNLTFKFNDWFYLGLNYRHIYEKISEEWILESRPHINGIFKLKFKGFEFENMNRFEFRIRDEAGNAWRYRNKSKIAFPVSINDLSLQSYLADEIFVDFEDDKINRNRIYLGTKVSLINFIEPEMFYLLELIGKNGNWIKYNIVGIKLNVVF